MGAMILANASKTRLTELTSGAKLTADNLLSEFLFICRPGFDLPVATNAVGDACVRKFLVGEFCLVCPPSTSGWDPV